MTEKTVWFVTENEGKLRETVSILETLSGSAPSLPSLCIRPRRLQELQEIQALDVAHVVSAKAASAFAVVGEPLLVEDTGLYCAATSARQTAVPSRRPTAVLLAGSR